MALPLQYNIRHVARRWHSALFTVLAVGIVVAIFVSMLALARGLSEAFRTTGSPSNVMLMRNGSTAESNSTVNREELRVAANLPLVAVGSDGTPLAIAETNNIASLVKLSGGNTNAVVRGTSARALELRPEIKLVEGRMFQPGAPELIVGTGAQGRFANATVGSRIKLVRFEWTIVGRFDAQRSAYDSEFWGDVELLNREFDRTLYSSVLLRAASPEAVPTLIASIDGLQRLGTVDARTEVSYYAEQTKASQPIQFLGMLISVIMAVGAVFAAMNTMYASVSGRTWEIATLRVLGFSRRAILISFMIESALTGLVGGVLGGLLALPVNGWATGTTSFTSFTEIAFVFRVTPDLLVGGVVFAVIIGMIGGFLPALQASRLPIVEGLRQGE